jgi:septum formation topological specificity factor MinE
MEEQAIYALERAIEEKDYVKEMLFQEILFVIKKYLEEIPLEGKDG